MALNDDERQLETAKLSVAFLQHITTLSGAAAVVVLALLERGDTDAPLAVPAFFFGLAAVVALYGIVFLIFEVSFDRVSRFTTIGLVSAVGGTFATALATLVIGAVVPTPTGRMFALLGFLATVFLGALYFTRRITGR